LRESEGCWKENACQGRFGLARRRIIDGTGKARYRADLAIDNGRTSRSAISAGPQERTKWMPRIALSHRASSMFIPMMTGCCWFDPGMSPKVSQGVYQRGDRQLRLQPGALAPRATLPQEFRLLARTRSIATRPWASYFDALDQDSGCHPYRGAGRSLDLRMGAMTDLERSATQRNARR